MGVPTVLLTECQDFQKARAVNSAQASAVVRVPTTTEPPSDDAGAAATQQALDLRNRNAQPSAPGQNAALILPYGVGANNDAFAMRVWGWRAFRPARAVALTKITVWVPTLLCDVTCTLSATQAGVANSTLLATEFFADTITLTIGNSNVSVEVLSPGSTTADCSPAHLLVDVKGYSKLELTFADSVNTPTKNALIALL